MAGRHKRDQEVKGYLLRLPPTLIARLDLCCSVLDVATGQRLPRNTRMQLVLEEFCEQVEAEHQQTPLAATASTIAPGTVPLLSPTISPELAPDLDPQPAPEPTQETPQKQEENEALERILAEREQYYRLSLRDFARHLYERNIYRATDRKTGEPKVIHSGTLSKWLKQVGMS